MLTSIPQNLHFALMINICQSSQYLSLTLLAVFYKKKIKKMINCVWLGITFYYRLLKFAASRKANKSKTFLLRL